MSEVGRSTSRSLASPINESNQRVEPTHRRVPQESNARSVLDRLVRLGARIEGHQLRTVRLPDRVPSRVGNRTNRPSVHHIERGVSRIKARVILQDVQRWAGAVVEGLDEVRRVEPTLRHNDLADRDARRPVVQHGQAVVQGVDAEDIHTVERPGRRACESAWERALYREWDARERRDTMGGACYGSTRVKRVKRVQIELIISTSMPLHWSILSPVMLASGSATPL